MDDFYRNLTIAALLQSPLSKMQAVIVAENIFNWPTHEARARFNEIADNCLLTDSGTLCVKRGDAVYAETGDRSVYISDEFLARCSPEQAAALSDAKTRLLTAQGEEG